MFQKIVDKSRYMFERTADRCRDMFEDIMRNKFFIISIIVIMIFIVILDRIIYVQAMNKGRHEKEVEAVQIGFARYENEKFVWNTNIFDNIEIAINLISDVNEKINTISELNLKNKEIISEVKSNLLNFSK